MKNRDQIIEPKNNKTSNDFLKLFIGIFVLIISLIALKYLANVLGII